MDDFSEILVWVLVVWCELKLVYLVKLATSRVFVIGLLYNSCVFMYYYVVEVLKFIFLYGNDEGFENVFVFLYLSGDGDCVVLMFEAFKEFLDVIGVLNVIKIW